MKPRIAGIRLFNWLALFLVVPLAYRLMGVFHALWVPLARRKGLGRLIPPGVGTERLAGAVRFIVIAIADPMADLRRAICRSSSASSGGRSSVLFAIGAATWLLLHVNAALERYVRQQAAVIRGRRRSRRWFASRGGSQTAW